MTLHSTSAGPSAAAGTSARSTSPRDTPADGKSRNPVRPTPLEASRARRIHLDADCSLGCRAPHDPWADLDRPVVSPAVRLWLFVALATAALMWGIFR